VFLWSFNLWPKPPRSSAAKCACCRIWRGCPMATPARRRLRRLRAETQTTWWLSYIQCSAAFEAERPCCLHQQQRGSAIAAAAAERPIPGFSPPTRTWVRLGWTNRVGVNFIPFWPASLQACTKAVSEEGRACVKLGAHRPKGAPSRNARPKPARCFRRLYRLSPGKCWPAGASRPRGSFAATGRHPAPDCGARVPAREVWDGAGVSTGLPRVAHAAPTVAG